VTSNPPAPIPLETELKLGLSPHAATMLKRHAALAGVKPVRRKLHTLYYDTPEHALARAGTALRVRRAAGRWILTLKTEGRRAAGLSVRPEWEVGLPDPRPDIARLPPEARALLPRKLDPRTLMPLYATVFWRTAWQLPGMEVALDQGEIHTGHAREPILELELEARDGDATALYTLARRLAEDLDLVPLPFSKAERGLALAGLRVAAPSKATRVALDAGMSASQGLAAIVGACLDQWQRNLPALAMSQDPEYLHQARVAVRRLRSTLNLFKPVIGDSASTLIDGLRAFMAAMGPARDLDVLLLDTWPALAAALPEHDEMQPLRVHLEQARRAARAHMAAEAASPRTTRLMLDFGLWLARAAWPIESIEPAEQAGMPLTEYADAALARLHRRFAKRIERLRERPPAERHAARIAGKKLRYAVEFFGALYPGRAARDYARALAAIQDRLGALNDAAVTTQLLDAQSAGQPFRYAAGLLAGAAQEGAVLGLDRAERACARFSRLPQFWR
jgi:inorganic triphosphatase YgiF